MTEYKFSTHFIFTFVLDGNKFFFYDINFIKDISLSFEENNNFSIIFHLRDEKTAWILKCKLYLVKFKVAQFEGKKVFIYFT